MATDHAAASSFAGEGRAKMSARLIGYRRLWLAIHKYLGLLAGVVLVILGLTGSILVFYTEIDAWLYPELKRVSTPPPETPYRPFPELMTAVRAAIPADGKLSNMYFPYQTQRELGVEYLKLLGTGREETHNVLIDPYTAKVVGTRRFYGTNPFQHSLIGVVWKLHYALLLPIYGDIVVGISGLVLMLSVVTDLYLWWPRGARWRQALTINWNAGTTRVLYDLHNTAGYGVSVVLIILFLSGVSMSLTPWFVQAVRIFSPVTEMEHLLVHPRPGQSSISIEQAVALVEQQYPEGRLRWVHVPSDDTTVYVIGKKDVPGVGWTGTRLLAVDPYSSTIEHVVDAKAGSAGDAFMLWMLPLHSGNAFGLPGRIVVCVTGLLCPVLAITGVYLWLKKRRSKAMAQGRRLRPVSVSHR